MARPRRSPQKLVCAVWGGSCSAPSRSCGPTWPWELWKLAKLTRRSRSWGLHVETDRASFFVWFLKKPGALFKHLKLACSHICTFYVFSELYEHHYNSSTGKVLFTAAKMLCHMLEADVPMVLPDDMDLPAVIHDLACQAITVCHSGKEHMKASQTFNSISHRWKLH